MTIQYFSEINGAWVIDSKGAATGVTYLGTDSNNYAVIARNHPVFNYANRTCQIDFERYIVVGANLFKDTSGNRSYVMDEINNPKFLGSIPGAANFGVNVPILNSEITNSDESKTYSSTVFVLDENGNQTFDSMGRAVCVAGVCSEVQFFVDNIIQNVHGLPVSIGANLASTIQGVYQIAA